MAETAIANLESIRVLPEHSQPQSKAKINFVLLGEWWICHFFHKFFSVCIKATVLNNPMTPSLLVLSATWANDSPMKAMPVWNWTNPWPRKIRAHLHHEFQNLFHRLMHWIPKVLEALQQVPTLDENHCFQDANIIPSFGDLLQRKICLTKKMQQHGGDTLSDQSSGLCNFVLSLREGDKSQPLLLLCPKSWPSRRPYLM